MGDGENAQATDSGGGRGPLIAIALVLLVLLIGLGIAYRNVQPTGGGGGGADNELLTLTRTALAATENLETDEADTHWSTIFQNSPEDDSVALNRALNRVLRVDRLSDQAMDASAEADKKKAARAKLPAAIDAAREGIADYELLTSDAVITLWLRSRIDLHQASLLPGSMTRPLQKETFGKLVDAIAGDVGKLPQSILLAGPLIDVLAKMEDPNDGLPPDVLGRATEAVTSLADANQDNLFLAIHAARLNIATENARAKPWVLRTESLAKAIEPTLSRAIKPIGFTADELVAKIVTEIDSGQWDEADQHMQFWFNVLNPTEMVRTDRRRASPHPLDKISFDSLRRLAAAAQQAAPIAKGNGPIDFAIEPIADISDAVALTPIDFDIDLQDDVAVITTDGKLTLWGNGDAGWTAQGDLQLDLTPVGLITTDLFMVDESHPERLKATGDSQQTGTYRHNTYPSLLAFGDGGVRIVSVDGREKTATADRLKPYDQSGLEDVSGVTAMAAGDLEGDGDLDLVVSTKSDGVRFFLNRGNRTFFEVRWGDGDSKREAMSALAIVDLDRDLDLDVVGVAAESGQVVQFENLLHLQFRSRVLSEIEPTPGATALTVADVDANVSWDLIVGGESQRRIVFSQTAAAGVWSVDRVVTDESAMTSSLIADLDNDTWPELLSSAADTSVTRIGPWGFDTSQPVTPDLLASLQTANLNTDATIDAVALRSGSPVAMRNQTPTEGHFLNVRFRGIADNAANSGRVNHFGIGSVLELRFGPHYRAQIINRPESHFGLGQFDTAGSIRVILPNGLTQTIRAPKVDTVVEEEQKLKGSCPYLYAWDGEKFVFLTDCLWAAPLGLQVAKGVVAKDRPWEYLKVDGRHVRARDGQYEFRITEELWEVAYLDKLAVTAVDHPADVDIWTNEKVGPPQIATPTVFAFGKDDLQPILQAIDTSGNDVTETLRSQDRDYVQAFDRRLRQGLCPPHWIDLDFGDVDLTDNGKGKRSAHLVLTGWILPTDTSLNIQIDQNPNLPAIEFPSVWVPDESMPEGWRKAIPFMGFPGGKTKTIVVDVTEILVADDPRLRVRTSAQIYWDSAQLAIQRQPAEFISHQLALQDAEVAFHGFSRRLDGEPRQPESYDYTDADLTPRWPPLRGGLSRFGPCLNRILDWDNELVVLGAGDEVRFSVSAPEAEIPKGWRRDFVLHCVGWDKDADLNTIAGQTIGPLPFREMTNYPPDESQSGQAEEVASGHRTHLQRHQSFRSFWYRTSGPRESQFQFSVETGR